MMTIKSVRTAKRDPALMSCSLLNHTPEQRAIVMGIRASVKENEITYVWQGANKWHVSYNEPPKRISQSHYFRIDGWQVTEWAYTRALWFSIENDYWWIYDPDMPGCDYART